MKDYIRFMILISLISSLALNLEAMERKDNDYLKSKTSQFAKEKRKDQLKRQRPHLFESTRFIFLKDGQCFVNDTNSRNFFHGDLANFNSGAKEVFGRAKHTFILVNIHNATQPPNLSNPFQYRPGSRSYIWGTPFENVLLNYPKLEAIHKKSALPRTWTLPRASAPLKQGNRLYISYVIIPEGSILHFLIGHSSPQQPSKRVAIERGIAPYELKKGERVMAVEDDHLIIDRPIREDFTAGGGVQIRWADLPPGTLILQAPLFDEGSQSQKGIDAPERPLHFQENLVRTIQEFNDTLRKKSIEGLEPLDISIVPDEQSLHGIQGDDFEWFLEKYIESKQIKQMK